MYLYTFRWMSQWPWIEKLDFIHFILDRRRRRRFLYWIRICASQGIILRLNFNARTLPLSDEWTMLMMCCNKITTLFRVTFTWRHSRSSRSSGKCLCLLPWIGEILPSFNYYGIVFTFAYTWNELLRGVIECRLLPATTLTTDPRRLAEGSDFLTDLVGGGVGDITILRQR